MFLLGCLMSKKSKRDSVPLSQISQCTFSRTETPFYASFKHFKHKLRPQKHYLVKEVTLSRQSLYSQAAHERNLKILQGLGLSLIVREKERTLKSVTYYVSPLDKNDYIKILDLIEIAQQCHEGVCAAQSNLGLSYLKFLLQYLETGKLLTLFGNRYLYIERTNRVFKNIYLFNQKVLTRYEDSADKNDVEIRTKFKNQLCEFFRINPNGNKKQIQEQITKQKYPRQLTGILIQFLRMFDSQVDLKQMNKQVEELQRLSSLINETEDFGLGESSWCCSQDEDPQGTVVHSSGSKNIVEKSERKSQTIQFDTEKTSVKSLRRTERFS